MKRSLLLCVGLLIVLSAFGQGRHHRYRSYRARAPVQAKAPVSVGPTQEDLLREQLHVAIARKEIAAAQARANVYKEELGAFSKEAQAARQAASEARVAATEAHYAVLGTTVPLIVAMIFVVVLVRNARGDTRPTVVEPVPVISERTRDQNDRQREELAQSIVAAREEMSDMADGVRHHRGTLLDGMRIFFYRQAHDAQAQGLWGQAVIYTIQALVAEFEAAELLNDESRSQYARVAMSNHSAVIVDHVEDYRTETDQAQWDTRDLEQIRILIKYATPDLVPTLRLLEQYTLRSVEKLRATDRHTV